MYESANERGEKTLQDDQKFWGGGGGRKGVKFRFEVSVSKKMGFFAIFSF